jgi:hypothetical protein
MLWSVLHGHGNLQIHGLILNIPCALPDALQLHHWLKLTSQEWLTHWRICSAAAQDWRIPGGNEFWVVYAADVGAFSAS